jgi:methylmalonyl-CoA carboxyltransferase small subunit
MKLRITVEGQSYEVDVEVLDDGAGAPPTGGPMYGSTSVGARTVAPPAAPKPAPDPAPAPSRAIDVAPSSGSGEKVVKAPIVGTIVQLKVAPGDSVEINQVLLVMEAMKMETNVASPIAGKVKAVRVSPGDPVKSGQVLVEFE